IAESTLEEKASESPPETTPTKEPDKPILITFQKARLHRAELELKRCHLIHSDGTYYNNFGEGRVSDVASAYRHTVGNALDKSWGDYPVIHLIDQKLAAELLLKRCSIEGVLSPAVVELLKLAPKNPQARAHILAGAGKMPPDE